MVQRRSLEKDCGKESVNDVRLSGRICTPPRLIGQPNGANHLVFQLETWHSSGRGWKREQYTVHAWNATAREGINLLAKGCEIVLEGYLTQRLRRIAGSDVSYCVVDVTARRFFVAGNMRQEG